MSHRILNPALSVFAGCMAFATLNACSSNEASSGSGGATSQAGASTSLGGATSGGASNGGTSSGGASSGGVAGAAQGGANNAGSGVGGAASGGASSGGAASGGAASGGATSGGTASGGKNGVGGTTSGGANNGGSSGAATGGASAGNAGHTSQGGSASGGNGGGSCPTQALSPGNTTKSIQIGGKSRAYALHVPAGYTGSKAVPLIIDFHGLGGSGPSEQTSSPYPAVTDADGVVMAFPTGLAGPSGNAWNVGPCCVDNTDDVAFAKALVEQVKTLACIDATRVYAVGFSMGGGMSHYLACHAADVFAAVAPAAFDLAQENVSGCTPSRPISVISFRGTSDPIVPYAGGASNVVSGHPITFLGAVNTFKKWAELNQCSGSASDSGNGCQAYSQCKNGVDVVLCTKQGGGHEPGNASVAWPLLKKHTLP